MIPNNLIKDLLTATDFSVANLKAIFKANEPTNKKDYYQSIRLALTGSKDGLEVYKLFHILGEYEAIERLLEASDTSNPYVEAYYLLGLFGKEYSKFYPVYIEGSAKKIAIDKAIDNLVYWFKPLPTMTKEEALIMFPRPTHN